MFTTPIFAVRAHMVSGSTVDLLLFAERYQADDYASKFSLPLGFDSVDVIELQVVGSLAVSLRAA
jgi:hypothetical protein